MITKSKFVAMILVSVTMFVVAYFLRWIWPAPGMDERAPDYWPLVREVELFLVFIGATLLWITGAVGYVYRDLITGERGLLMYLLPVLAGSIISFFLAYIYWFGC